MDVLIELAYLVAASLFILGLKRLSSPATAPQGNRLSAAGMLVAVVATLLSQQVLSPFVLLAGLVLGGGIGVLLARRVEMTGMPELVAAFNGLGGLASVGVALAEGARLADGVEVISPITGAVLGLSVLVGSVTLSGSFVAYGKLAGKLSGNPISFSGMRVLTLLLAVAAVGLIAYYASEASEAGTQFLVLHDSIHLPVLILFELAVLALVLGLTTTLPIGGADMPVVVSLLNAYSGLAAALTGFVLGNTALVVSGALVGASGLILTQIMCDAMNRSLLNVLAGGFGGGGGEGSATSQSGGSIQETQADDVAVSLAYADRVVIVPGYGMAVAQAQHQVRELADVLTAKGVNVRFAIHPVAGRMPGHMNVLLAEANVSYDLLAEMDEINGEFDRTDVVLVVGANDVVNPAARTDTSSPIYGMPILDVDKASQVVVLKRSMRPGYSGVENALFFMPGTRMLFGDAKESIATLTTEVKAL